MGLGGSVFGVSPFGYTEVAHAHAPTGLVLVDDDGRQTGSRKINALRTYEFDTHGRARGMGNTRQLVLLAVTTVKGSCVLPYLGHDLTTIKDIGPDFDRRVDNALRGALASLVAEKRVEILLVRVEHLATPGTTQERGALILLRWRDLTDPAMPTYEERA